MPCWKLTICHFCHQRSLSQTKIKDRSSVGSWVMLCSLLSNHLCWWKLIYVTQADMFIWDLEWFYAVCLVTLAWISLNLSQKFQGWETKWSAWYVTLNEFKFFSVSCGITWSNASIQLKQTKQTNVPTRKVYRSDPLVWKMQMQSPGSIYPTLPQKGIHLHCQPEQKKGQDGDNSSYRCSHLAEKGAQTTVGRS